MMGAVLTHDVVLTNIADFVTHYDVTGSDAYETARYCLLDSLGCAFEALDYPECVKLLWAASRRGHNNATERSAGAR